MVGQILQLYLVIYLGSEIFLIVNSSFFPFLFSDMDFYNTKNCISLFTNIMCLPIDFIVFYEKICEISKMLCKDALIDDVIGACTLT